MLGLDATPTADQHLHLIVMETRQKLDDIGDSVPVILKWVKGHSGIEVNERADMIADWCVKRALAAKRLWHSVAAQDQDSYRATLRNNVIAVLDDDLDIRATDHDQSAERTTNTHSHLILQLEERCPVAGADDYRCLADRVLDCVNVLPVPNGELQQTIRSGLAALRLPE